MQHQARGGSTISALRGCALFERPNGTIRHIHRVATIAGAEEISAKEMEARARQIAAEAGLDEGRLEALHFDPRAMEAGQRYRVDPASRRLTPSGAPGPARGSRD